MDKEEDPQVIDDDRGASINNNDPFSHRICSIISISDQPLFPLQNHNHPTRPSPKTTFPTSLSPLPVFETTNFFTTTQDELITREIDRLSSETWNPNHHYQLDDQPTLIFNDGGLDPNYDLPSLLGDVGSSSAEAQQCVDDDGDTSAGGEAIGEWMVEQQQYSGFLVWDHLGGQIGGEGIGPANNNITDVGSMGDNPNLQQVQQTVTKLEIGQQGLEKIMSLKPKISSPKGM
ncbi:hypothetical protein QJS10_CPB11g01930 [Acorus calamus]|uniref:Uncharacterized protein n=1 Tax=Acorus calamus TaxID=4465 RepID=A0AAV9DPB2_ACOCL|nr:hypothetical protein QJS10_CPB11g01930 [Acorus calamus]